MHRDTAPAERWQHGADPEVTDIGRQQVGSPLPALKRSGKISQAEILAADRFYGDFALGVMRAKDEVRAGTGGSHDDGMAVATILALGRYREACQAVGKAGTALLHALVINSLTLTAIGQRTNLNAHVVSGMALLVLKQLSDHYDAADGARPSVMARTRAATVSHRDTDYG